MTIKIWQKEQPVSVPDVWRVVIETDDGMAAEVKTENGITTYTYEEERDGK